MDRRQIPLAGADAGATPVMTIAMLHEVRAAQDRVAARMIRERRGRGAVLALDEGVARDPLGAWHRLQSGSFPGWAYCHGVNLSIQPAMLPAWPADARGASALCRSSVGFAAGRRPRVGRKRRALRSAPLTPRIGSAL